MCLLSYLYLLMCSSPVKNAAEAPFLTRPLHIMNSFGGLVVSILASGTRVRGFEPSRSCRIFSGEKIRSMPSFGREVKLFAPCRRFAAC
jgi:hypothetical protein